MIGVSLDGRASGRVKDRLGEPRGEVCHDFVFDKDVSAARSTAVKEGGFCSIASGGAWNEELVLVVPSAVECGG